MNDELSIRQMAMRLRLAGESIESICGSLKRSTPLVPHVVATLPRPGPRGLV